MKFCLPLLLVLLSCSNPFEENKEELEARCTPVLENILRIQTHREIAREDFELTLNDYTAGRLSEEAWQSERTVWLERESLLAGEVNRLYNYSYETKCLK